MDFLQNHIESLIFCSAEPLKPEEIRQCLSEMFEAEVPEEDVLGALESLLTKYEGDIYPFQVFKVGGGYQFLTKPAYQTSISILLKQKSKKRLSTSALETLAIIAYKQPLTKHQIEQIRGVNCDYAIQKLLEKELIEIQGKSDGVGRPILYGSSSKFMEYFGINSLKDLPTPKDFPKEENQIGDASSENDLSERSAFGTADSYSLETDIEKAIENITLPADFDTLPSEETEDSSLEEDLPSAEDLPPSEDMPDIEPDNEEQR